MMTAIVSRIWARWRAPTLPRSRYGFRNPNLRLAGLACRSRPWPADEAGDSPRRTSGSRSIPFGQQIVPATGSTATVGDTSSSSDRREDARLLSLFPVAHQCSHLLFAPVLQPISRQVPLPGPSTSAMTRSMPSASTKPPLPHGRCETRNVPSYQSAMSWYGAVVGTVIPRVEAYGLIGLHQPIGRPTASSSGGQEVRASFAWILLIAGTVRVQRCDGVAKIDRCAEAAV